MTTPQADFDSYWRETLDELGGIPMAAESTPIPLRTTDFATLYGVHLTSIGPYRIFGYLSVPTAAGPHPAVYFTPSYQSAVQPIPQGASNELRRHVITFSLAARGQRNADKPFAAAFPGWLTTGITDPTAYIFRGVVADCLRCLEFLLSRNDIDSARIAITGNDLAFITAALGTGALGKSATHVATAPELFFGMPSQNAAGARTEIIDHLRQSPNDKNNIEQTLALYDLRAFAASAPTARLIQAGATGSELDGTALAPLADSAHAVLRESEQSRYKDGLALMIWLAEQFGMPEPNVILPAAWH
jgi:cephalosporin-C deacetylase